MLVPVDIEIQSNFSGSNTFGTMKISSRPREFEPLRVDYSARPGGLIGISFWFSLKWRYVVCSQLDRLIEVILVCTHNIPFLIWIRKTPSVIPNLQLWAFFQGTQEWVRNSRGKRAISVRAIEVLLYIYSSQTSGGLSWNIKSYFL